MGSNEVNNDIPIDEELKNSYDINELEQFFKSRTLNESRYNNSIKGTDILSFDEVEERFLVEVLRDNDYSVFKVDQGGYYYVFWIPAIDNVLIVDTINSQDVRLVVNSTLYIPSNNKRGGIFEKVSKGDSLSDLHLVDPYVYLNNLLSTGIYAYSFVDKETVIEYKCTYENGEYVVNTKKEIPIGSSASAFRTIRKSDYPQ